MRLFTPLFFIASLPMAGCNPTCASTCRKIMSCSDELDLADMNQTDCEASCAEQDKLYDGWDNPDLQDRFIAAKQCVKSETCEDLADGVCYDEEIYIF